MSNKRKIDNASWSRFTKAIVTEFLSWWLTSEHTANFHFVAKRYSKVILKTKCWFYY